ncbi:hypothetical protein C0995_016663, partial [Termitomyces sp. Mi166
MAKVTSAQPYTTQDLNDPMSINQVERTSTDQPITPSNEDDDEHTTILPLLPQANPNMNDEEPAPQDNQTAPRRSTRISIPTSRSQPDNPPISRLERAVQESREAAARIQTARAERRQAAEAQVDANVPNQELVQGDGDNVNVPDLANVASLDEIENLLALAEAQADPISLDLEDEPTTWRQAQDSPDAKKWRAAYEEEL